MIARLLRWVISLFESIGRERALAEFQAQQDVEAAQRQVDAAQAQTGRAAEAERARTDDDPNAMFGPAPKKEAKP